MSKMSDREIETEERNKLGCEYCQFNLYGNVNASIFRDDYCKKCGRNLNKVTTMIEVFPLEFPSWEEFKETFNTTYYYNVGTDLHLQNALIKGETTILIEVSFDDYGFDIEYKYYCFSPEGYKEACGEIERIRIEFIMELAGGNK